MSAEISSVPVAARLRITETFLSLQGEANAVGWPTFFIVSTLSALPALLLLARLRRAVRQLEDDARAPDDAPGAVPVAS